jgi:hypothetical protein
MKKINLEDLKKDTNLFEVPENYFDALPSKIQATIQQRKSKEQQSIVYQLFTVKNSIKIAVSLCAVVLAFFVAIQFYAPTKIAESHNLSEVSEKAIQDYLLHSGVGTDEIMQICSTQGSELSIDGLPLDISQELLEEELSIENINDYL